MKIAKATTQDMEAAMAVTHILETLCKGYLPDSLKHLDSSIFDIDNHEHCREVLGLLIEKANSASIFRVTFGMQVMLDPVNKMVDPELSYLDHHPERVRSDELLQAFNRAISKVEAATACHPNAVRPLLDEAIEIFGEALAGDPVSVTEGGAA